MSKIVLFVIPMLLAAPAGAAPKETKAPESPRRYDFDDDIVEGGIAQADGSLVNVLRPIKRSSLIKIRDSFLPELIKSAEDL